MADPDMSSLSKGFKEMKVSNPSDPHSYCDDLQWLKNLVNKNELNIVLKMKTTKRINDGSCQCNGDNCGGTWRTADPQKVTTLLEYDNSWIPCRSIEDHMVKVLIERHERHKEYGDRIGKIFPELIDFKDRIKKQKPAYDKAIDEMRKRRKESKLKDLLKNEGSSSDQTEAQIKVESKKEYEETNP